MSQYLEAVLQICDRVEARIPEIAEIAEIVAERHAAGGKLRVIWEGGGRNGPQGPQNELKGRSGGMSAFDAPFRLRVDEPTNREKDVAILGWERAPDPSDLEVLKICREKFFVIAFGPRALPELAEYVKLADAWIDTGMGADDRAVTLPDGTTAGRVNALTTVLNSWAFIGEVVAALTREGKMPTMLRSHTLPGSKEWNARYRQKMHFHDDLTVPPIPAGTLSRRYLEQIRALVRKFGKTQQDNVARTAGLIVEELAQGRPTLVAQTGHTTYEHVGQYEDKAWAVPWVLYGNSKGRLQVWFKDTPDKALVLRLGYSGEDRTVVDILRQKRQRLMLVSSGSDPRPDFQIPADLSTFIDMGWEYGDACVTVEGYPNRILPPSGVMQLVAYECVNVEVLAKLASGAAEKAADGVAGVENAWPPPSLGNGKCLTVAATDDFLKIPEAVEAESAKAGAAPFTVAQTAPTVDLVCHQDLPDQALNGTGWSSWGDIEVADDGLVYTGIGNHGRNDQLPQDGGGYAFIYCYNPETKILQRVVDVNKVVGVQEGDPTWSKVHAGIHEAKDGKIYFSCTLNAGNRSFKTTWSERVPGGQLFQYDPETGHTAIVATFPGEVTPTTRLDRDRNIWYANMEGKSGPTDISLVAYDLQAQRLIYQSPADAVTASRNLALARNGAVFFNGRDGLWRYDSKTQTIAPTRSAFPEKVTMRSSVAETSNGYIYGTTMGLGTGLLFRYSPARDQLELLGPDFLTGGYTAVTALSPDEKFIYYLPGSHGGASKIGTPVIQYNIATGNRKVLAFLRTAMEKSTGYSPAGTYGVKISADGSKLYVGLNGNVSDDGLRPTRHAKGFGLTALATIHIPPTER